MNAINTIEFKPDYGAREKMRNNYNLKNDDFVILYVGRLEKLKGPGKILESILYLKKKLALS